MTELKDKFQGFGRTPSPEVWDRISNDLDNQKPKRKVWIFFISAGVLIATVLSVYLYNHNDNNTVGKSDTSIVEETYIKIHQVDELDNKTSVRHNTNDNIVKESDKQNLNNKKSDIAENYISGVEKNAHKTIAHKDNEKNIPKKALLETGKAKKVIENKKTIKNQVNPFKTDNATINNSITLNTSLNKKTRQFSLREEDQKRLKDINIIDILSASKLLNMNNDKLLTRAFDISIPKARKWCFAITYKQSFTKNELIQKSPYTIVPIETFFGNEAIISTGDVTSKYTNSSPYFIELQARRSLSPNANLVTGIEYGSSNNTILYDNKIAVENMSNTYSGSLGYDHKLLGKNRLEISFGLAGIISYINNTSTEQNNTYNSDIPNAILTEDISNINANNDANNKVKSFFSSELSSNISYKVTSKYAINLKPFVKKHLSKEYTFSNLHSVDTFWGLGIGLIH